MNRKRMLLLGSLALALSALVTFFVYRELDARVNPVQPTDNEVIVVATQRLPLGTLLESHHLRTVPWTAGAVIEGSFSSTEEVVGRGVVVPMLPNEPILESKLAPREAGAGLTTAIPAGMRAVSVKVNHVIGVAGFVLPGTRVDVIVTGSPSRNHDTEVSKVFLENVQVLAADQNVEHDSQGRPQEVQVITLLVNPEDAQKLALAQVDGRIQLALRHPLDLDRTDPSPVEKRALYTRPSSDANPTPPPARRVQARPAPPPPAPEPPAPPKPRTFQVELIQGTQRNQLEFERESTPAANTADSRGEIR